MPIKLAKLDDLKTRLDVHGDDDLLTSLLEAVSAMCAQPRFSGVDLRRTPGIVEFPVAERRSSRLELDRYPIESITEVKSVFGPATDADFDAATALTQDEDFYIDSADLGVLIRIYDWWRMKPRSNRVTYTAGFGDPDALGVGELAPPEDLQHGCIQQCVWFYNTRGTAGLRELDAGEMGGRVSLAEAKPHADLIAACQRLRRVSF